MTPMLQKRFFCTELSKTHRLKWNIKQVTKSNFIETLEEIKTHISDSDYIAVSLQKTGSFSAPWHRVLPFDAADSAYCKAKHAAERFQVLQFAVCPFSIEAPSKVVAHPYNFHLFPRDELKLGMPSYSFSCQTSYLTSMAQEGFDFNACIYDVADAVFMGRIRSRIKYWRNEYKESSKRADEALVVSLRKLVLGSELYGSRPCINIDVCSEHQVNLVLEILREFSEDLVPLIIPAKGGGTQAIRVVLTSSSEDKDLLQKELQNLEEEQNKRIRGFREVIDLISASQKPVVSHNSLNDFTFVHSKFLAPLPPNVDEFKHSLHLIFPHILDINHLMMDIGPRKKKTNLPAAISYLKRRFFVPIDMEIPQEAGAKEGKIHGHNVLRISHLFVKLCSILKILHDTAQSDISDPISVLEGYTNIFNPCCTSSQPIDGSIRMWTGDKRKVSSEDLVFLWGFRAGMSAGALKSLLQGSHDIFSGDFDVRLVDKSCGVVVFWQPGLSRKFLELMGGEGLCGSLREMVTDGLKAASYETYERVCSLGLWEVDLADSLDKTLADPDCLLDAGSETKPSAIYWNSDSIINFYDL
ncbi:poly(A)-specific ribonuclease PARN-like isoform X2 [Malania oleifera]|uniref:poly(A)-specific ribonuclease PARN-like isoform X2 n=1 Tax=Malania oleifera TaxID=397392 RepID=UPI0025AE5CB0|nr:poly(A)-specific ribonuclease PARN-like isoform X2 [Malania oleifera]